MNEALIFLSELLIRSFLDKKQVIRSEIKLANSQPCKIVGNTVNTNVTTPSSSKYYDYAKIKNYVFRNFELCTLYTVLHKAHN